ncbi:DeoR/GlpR family DNA-binding transcription regulator [Leeia sp. TBRC 13508]|uniref:DeoR/GlpR family DNA-binding transcription regulator n=1 Tax=Leeia speluncae TaxID=2884804 RepID=A0ABS8D8A6_9NEIS|nr:DeoR/GlpR family DNA-binding transcription regulator [Leeia speluncae]MCB6184441.1 DeoR/GlpR family DNA-binding transcription regulator [Leeia speluncae]
MSDYAVFPDQRQAAIRERLQKFGRVVCIHLAEEMGVSEHTIRRDLQELANQGYCKKVYGGAVSIAPGGQDFERRLENNVDEKSQLAKVASPIFRNNTCIFIDAGTTNLCLAQAIPLNVKLTVVTHSPAIAVEVLKHPLCEVVLLGGKMSKQLGAATGVSVIKQLEEIYFDLCVLGVCGFDIDEGVTAFDYEDAEMKKILVKQSSEVLIALTAEKISSVANFKVTPLQNVSYLVFSGEISDSQQHALDASGVKVIQG